MKPDRNRIGVTKVAAANAKARQSRLHRQQKSFADPPKGKAAAPGRVQTAIQKRFDTRDCSEVPLQVKNQAGCMS